MKFSIECCEVFPKIALSLRWFRFEDRTVKGFTHAMPCIKGSDNRDYRVNHCPSCGKEVRSIMMVED